MLDEGSEKMHPSSCKVIVTCMHHLISLEWLEEMHCDLACRNHPEVHCIETFARMR